VLARLKGLRGTAFDIFGKTQERRAERQWAADYLVLADEFSRSLSHDTLDIAIALANIPDDIRGFGHVKEKNQEKAKRRYAEMLDQYHQGRRMDRAA
jgi:indolepyruvate ferredoxin oxidoreductase